LAQVVRTSEAIVIACALGACDGGADVGVDGNRVCAGTHDEDGDGLTDNCDNCPTVANPTQADTTEEAVHAFADGVGDACDYRPGLAGDEIGALFTFADPAQANAWNGSGWTIANETVTASGAASWTSSRGEMGDGVIVVARVEAIDLTGGDLRVAIDGNGTNAGATCTLRGDQLVAEELSGSSANKPIGTIDIAQPFSLVAWRRVLTTGAEVACRVEQGAKRTEVITDLADELTIGAYALVSTGATATLSSVIVYTSPGPKNP
jgi:hypothetical protein